MTKKRNNKYIIMADFGKSTSDGERQFAKKEEAELWFRYAKDDSDTLHVFC